jgi:hypothetical protein
LPLAASAGWRSFAVKEILEAVLFILLVSVISFSHADTFF